MEIVVGVSSSPEKAGGISSYSKELALCLSRMGHVVHYVCPPSVNLEWFEKNKINFLFVKEEMPQVPQCRTLYEYIESKRIELIINNDNSILQSIAPLVGCPFIAVCHMESRAIATMASVNSEWCDYTVAISYDMHERIVKKYNLNPLKVPVVFGGLGTAVDRKVDRNDGSGNEMTPIRCLFSGNYSWYKGADLFLDFLMSESVPNNTEYFWYGEVPEKIKRKLAPLEHVKHVGRVQRETFLAALDDADVLLFPSRQEGCPMSVLEAMKFGVVPVVSNGRGAMRHIVTHGKDGFVCSLSDWVDESAEVLSRLAADRTLLSSYGKSAVKTCKERFSIEEMAGTLLLLSDRSTVDRRYAQALATVYRWHRPGINGSRKASLLERFCYRTGIVRVEGVLKV